MDVRQQQLTLLLAPLKAFVFAFHLSVSGKSPVIFFPLDFFHSPFFYYERCKLDNEVFAEGEGKELRLNQSTRPSSDVVMLLELKKCNEPSDAPSRRFLPSLLHSLEKEFSGHKITKNRYSLVVFGGAEPFNSPTVRTIHGQEFVAPKELDNLFSNLTYGIINRLLY